MKKKFNLWFVIPLLAFVGLVAFMAIGLTRDPHLVPSPLINRPAPNFLLPQLHAPGKTFSPADLKGQVWLLNVWASWCVSCREEHPVLLRFSRTHAVPMVGLDYKDQTPDAQKWLADYGDPYSLTAVDADGRVGIDYGVYGVPETYVIDKTGVIRYKQIGPITPEALQQTILPLIAELKK
ncbi:MAG: DsbE family thiol:disulfide interchange protein [Betaproteobacteria bacterium]|nr:DsbE family thiol:disulfide interchange protein [Betaproteobacteria bacterium]MDE2131350.1 DsbE family thiol:disulfide interchange protein [Betaproteobacteria bacterium]MDE2212676.1 DsbE family thiol:disulfide interchange protein [Betaproteobacteria bacterium]MDE2624738.1 DsbE family thiol:disulfide interchange protein [Betaproteobacteria bacterium]